MTNTPLFIVFEGTDGSGTTTQGNLLTQQLQQAGHSVHRTAQPSPGPIGQLIRAALRGQLEGRLDARTVALLFAADRVDHGHREIQPALDRGDVVVCDRYLGSSLAFQVVDGSGGISEDWLLEINSGALVPDVSIWVDVPPEVAVARIVARGQPQERFEVLDTLRQVRQRYRDVFARAPKGLGRCVVVDGQPAPPEVAASIYAIAMECLSNSATKNRSAN